MTQITNPYPRGPVGRTPRGVTLARINRMARSGSYFTDNGRIAGGPRAPLSDSLGVPDIQTIHAHEAGVPRAHRRAQRPRALTLLSYSRQLPKRFALAKATANLDRLRTDEAYRTRMQARRAETDARAHRRAQRAA